MFKIPDFYAVLREYKVSPFDTLEDKLKALRKALEDGLITSQELSEGQGIIENMRMNGA